MHRRTREELHEAVGHGDLAGVRDFLQQPLVRTEVAAINRQCAAIRRTSPLMFNWNIESGYYRDEWCLMAQQECILEIAIDADQLGVLALLLSPPLSHELCDFILVRFLSMLRALDRAAKRHRRKNLGNIPGAWSLHVEVTEMILTSAFFMDALTSDEQALVLWNILRRAASIAQTDLVFAHGAVLPSEWAELHEVFWRAWEIDALVQRHGATIVGTDLVAHLAIKSDEGGVAVLLRHGGDPNVSNAPVEDETALPSIPDRLQVGWYPPLIGLLESGYYARATLLVTRGFADVDLRSADGRSALMAISSYSRIQNPELPVDIARLLLACGAEINAVDHQGQTPLHYAARSDHPEIVMVLLEHGADPRLVSDSGETPLDVATEANASILIAHSGCPWAASETL